METRTSIRRKQNDSDRIRSPGLDDLPEDIVTHILTFLPTLDAIRTSFLSRKWRNQKLWCSLSFLDLDYSKFPLTPHDPSLACTRFSQFIDQTLERRSHFPIQKFRLHFDLVVFSCRFKLNKWISYAISHNATDLDISFSKKCSYYFNFTLLKDSHVRDLRVSSCEITHYGMSNLILNSIQSVSISDTMLLDNMVVNMIPRFNNLESLALSFCRAMKNVIICSPTLKNLSLEHSSGSLLEICSTNLNSLRISDFYMNEYCIKDSASLVEAYVHFNAKDDDKLSYVVDCWSEVIRLLTHVKQLTTQNYWFQLLCRKDESLERCVFEKLNHLELLTGCGQRDLLGLAACLKTCPNITTLTLDFSLHMNEHNGLVPKEFVDKPIEFSIPNLKILNLKNTDFQKIEELVKLVKKHGACLENIVLCERNGMRSSIPL